MSQNIGQITVQCFKLCIPKICIQLFFHILQISKPVNDQTVIFLCADRNFILIIFIQNISDNLLQNILHGNDPGCLAIFIHNNCHMDLSGLHSMKKISNPPCFRNQGCLADNSGQFLQRFELRPGILCHKLKRIFIMDNSFDIVNILLIYRITGIPLFQHSVNHVLEQYLLVKGHHILSVSHDIMGFCLIKRYDILDHFRLILLDDALFMSFIYNGNDFLFCDRLFCTVYFHTKRHCCQSGDPGDRYSKRL